MQKFKLFSLLMVALVLVQCQNDDLEDQPKVSEEEPTVTNTVSEVDEEESEAITAVLTEEVASTLLSGTIESSDGTALAEAHVIFEGKTVQTDEFGFFSFPEKVEVNAQNTFIKVVKEGYFDGFRSFKANASEANIVNVQLLQKAVSKPVSSVEATEINIDGVDLSFDEESFVYADGKQVAGDVTVSGDYLDSSDGQITEIMPGSLLGVREDEELVMLQNYGMVNIELTDAENNEVEVAKGKKVSLTLPAEEDAPNEIGLWHFNETHGIWVQSGTATKVGEEYLAEVTHFSTWLLAVDVEGYSLELEIFDQSDEPMVGSEVLVEFENGRPVGSFITDTEGKITLERASATQKMVINVIEGCGTIPPVSFNAITENTSKKVVFTIDNRKVVEGAISGCEDKLSNQVFSLVHNSGGSRKIYPIETDENGSFQVSLNCSNFATDSFQVLGNVTGVIGEVHRSNTVAVDDNMLYLQICITEEPITFEDSNLESAIRSWLKYDGEWTREYMATVDTLDIGEANITNISGVEQFPNLKELYLNQNNISDISILSKMPQLETISLRVNNITDISPLAGLVNLDRLFIHENQISDISVLQNLENLTTLTVYKNSITDISPILNLEKLDLAYVCLENDIPQSQIDQLQENFPELDTDCFDRVITFEDSNLESALREYLDYDGEWTEDYLASINTIVLIEKNITSLKGLEYLSNIEVLIIANNNISDFSHISNLTTLTSLNLFGNQLTDISAVSNLTNLEDISFANNQITDISPLSSLGNLKSLSLHTNSISDISPISNLTSITKLWLHTNQITDISAVNNLTNLEFISSEGNQITDISSLFELNSLKTASVCLENDIPQSQIDQLQANYPQLGSDCFDRIITFEDENLESALREYLGYDGEWTESYLASIDSIVLNDNDISNLTGLEFMWNVKKIWITNNNISDLSAISNLHTITSLNLSGNNIADINQLSWLNNLKEIFIQSCNISDISVFVNFSNLETAGLDNNQISDISALQGLTNLKELFATINNISDISVLSNLTALENLWLNNNQISDVSVIRNFTQLIQLGLDENNITDLSPIMNLSNLVKANVCSNNVPLEQINQLASNYADIETNCEGAIDIGNPALEQAIRETHNYYDGFTQDYIDGVTHIDINNENLTDISGIEHFVNLESLLIENNQISDLSPLVNLTKLRFFYAYENQFSDITPLANLTQLEIISIGKTQVNDISILSNLTNLRELFFQDLGVSDISVLANFTSLESTGFDGNQITDISSLQNLTQLKYLFATSNSISDISTLSNLTSLEKLYLNGNQISDASVIGNFTQLKELGLDGNQISNISNFNSLTNLVLLGIRANQIGDISVLSNLTSLEELYMNANSVSDISSLLALNNLRIAVVCEDNNIPQEQINQLQAKFPNAESDCWD